MKFLSVLALSLITASAALAGMSAHTFPNIDGGTHDTTEWAGKPVLVVNTASQCGFTYQYNGLQALYDRYRDAGLVVLAVPSDDFRQELATAEEVKEFCELNFALDLPMTDIMHVKGRDAHPFYRDLQAQTGFVPRWNFNKVLIGPDGTVAQTWGSGTKPMSVEITGAIEALLNGS